MYLELHSRSAFSFLRGGSLPEDLAAVCADMHMPSMALLDRDGVYGTARFHLAAQKLGIKAHIGVEVTLQDGSVLPLLVQNRRGYQNLCQLITQTKLRSPKHLNEAATAKAERCRGNFRDEPTAQQFSKRVPIGARHQTCRDYPTAISYEELEQYAEGLIALTGGADGPVARLLTQPLADSLAPAHQNAPAAPGRGSDSGFDTALETAQRLVNIFGACNVYAELQRHYHRDEEARNQAVMEIARHLHLPLLATNGVCHARREQRQILDVFTCIRNHVPIQDAGRLLARNSERHLKSAAEMARLFSDLPAAVANTAELSSRLDFTLADLGYQFPQYPTPDGKPMINFLRERTWAGARNRYGDLSKSSREYQQIERELALIDKLNLAGYFLIVWDIVEFCRAEGILVQGRGSAANSAVCYSLGITAVDPVGMGLLFERFLSEQRGEWPDIDLDLPSGDRRERVIQYVYKRYGTHGAAMTANVITYRGRSASREIGKVLGFDEATVSRLAGLVRAWEWHDPKDTPERQFRDAGLDVGNPLIKKFFELYIAVQDLPRHLGQHSGGLVMCQGRLDSVVPLEPASMPGRVVVQWDKDDCADMGMIKVDLLGLGMMAVLEDSLNIIHDSYDEPVDLAHLPPDDPAVYTALQQADTVGMFQVESRAQMASLPRLHPEKFYDIVVQVGIIRPGPIVGKMVHPYLKRRQGKEPPECFHPSLEPVLKRTLGVPLFQEQLLRMAMIAAGFTGGEAEDLRRAFSHKRSEARMREIEIKLRRGMDQNGITGKTQDAIVQSITAFALYGFPESHAASFALLAYASAYLKCHYLAAFTAALLNNEPMGFYHPSTIVKDAQRHGLKIKPIDVTRSDWLCTVEREVSPPNCDPESFGCAQDKLREGSAVHGLLKADPSASLAAARFARDDTVVGSAGKVGIEVGYALRMGLLYARGVREDAGRAILRERDKRPFTDIEDLTRRVPELRKNEMTRLAEIGALNWIRTPGSHGTISVPWDFSGNTEESTHGINNMPWLPQWERDQAQANHRRKALWQAHSASRPAGPLLRDLGASDDSSPLASMDYNERIEADFRGTGLTLGKHPMALRRNDLRRMGVSTAAELRGMRHGAFVRAAGSVIVRQRPGTAKGFVFLSLEDETGIANAIVTPDLFDRYRFILVQEPFLLVEGVLQNIDNVASVKASRVRPLNFHAPAAASHDFH